MRFKKHIGSLVILLFILLLVATDANAALDNQGVLDQVVREFRNSATAWMQVLQDAATWLFWALVTISMIWTFGFMALRNADLMEFFAELMRFIIFTGFFWWLLENGPNFSMSIIESMQQLGQDAVAKNGVTVDFTPSGIVDIGFVIFGKALDRGWDWALSPIDSTLIAIAGFGILFLCALLAINVLMLMITAWIMAFGGIFILGFGGSRWTSDIAITYYKHVLGIALQIMVMILLVGIGWSIIDNSINQMEEGLKLAEMGVLFVVVLCVYVLANKIPLVLAGIVTGPTGGPAIGQMGGASAVNAAVDGVKGIAGGALSIAGGAAAVAGGAAALYERFKGGGGQDGGSDSMADDNSTGDGFSGAEASASQTEGTGNTPYAQAGGFSNDKG